MQGIRQYLPWVERVGTYGDTRGVLNKSPEQLAELRDAGLAIVYHGMETGDDAILRQIDKGGTRAQAIETAQRLRQAGIAHSVMVLLGVAGRGGSQRHTMNTASALNEMDPAFVGALTTTVVPNTPLFEQQARGEFTLPDRFGLLEELRQLVSELALSNCRFSANHASNYLPLRGTLPGDKEALLRILDRVLTSRDERYLKPEFLRGL